MKKNKFIKSTMILIIGGMITKMLGLVIRIVLTRTIGTTGIGLYSMILPTFLLLNSIAQLGLPTALNILISSNKYNSKNLVFTSVFISLFIDLVIIVFLILCSKWISVNLLHNKALHYGLLSIGFTLPFITISNCLRSYFFAKQRMYPHVITNIIEDIVRLILILVGGPIILKSGIQYLIAYIILTNVASELSSIIIFLYLLPNKKYKKQDLKPNTNSIKSLFNIAIPTTGSRLIGSIGFFLEPIIITYVLLKIGYTKNFITEEYGIINGYVMQLVLIPSFFTNAISQALIPIISRSYTNKNIKLIKSKVTQAILISLLVGVPATLIFEFKPEVFLRLLFKTNKGIKYIKIVAPICILHYIQAPISSTLQAMNKARISMKGTLFGMILRTLTLFIFSFLKIGMWSLIVALSINIIFVTCFDYINLKKILNKKISY